MPVDPTKLLFGCDCTCAETPALYVISAITISSGIRDWINAVRDDPSVRDSGYGGYIDPTTVDPDLSTCVSDAISLVNGVTFGSPPVAYNASYFCYAATAYTGIRGIASIPDDPGSPTHIGSGNVWTNPAYGTGAWVVSGMGAACLDDLDGQLWSGVGVYDKVIDVELPRIPPVTGTEFVSVPGALATRLHWDPSVRLCSSVRSQRFKDYTDGGWAGCCSEIIDGPNDCARRTFTDCAATDTEAGISLHYPVDDTFQGGAGAGYAYQFARIYWCTTAGGTCLDCACTC